MSQKPRADPALGQELWNGGLGAADIARLVGYRSRDSVLHLMVRMRRQGYRLLSRSDPERVGWQDDSEPSEDVWCDFRPAPNPDEIPEPRVSVSLSDTPCRERQKQYHYPNTRFDSLGQPLQRWGNYVMPYDRFMREHDEHKPLPPARKHKPVNRTTVMTAREPHRLVLTPLGDEIRAALHADMYDARSPWAAQNRRERIFRAVRLGLAVIAQRPLDGDVAIELHKMMDAIDSVMPPL